MKVKVDFDLCEANAVCMDIAPEIFKVDDDDHLHILLDDVPDGLRSKAQEAVRLCPRQALSIDEG